MEAISRKERLTEISHECESFMDKCQENIRIAKELQSSSRSLVDQMQGLHEEITVRREESIANKSRGLAIMSIANQAASETALRNMTGSAALAYSALRGIKDDHAIVWDMIKEVEAIPIPDERQDLLSLRAELLKLSFLPKPR